MTRRTWLSRWSVGIVPWMLTGCVLAGKTGSELAMPPPEGKPVQPVQQVPAPVDLPTEKENHSPYQTTHRSVPPETAPSRSPRDPSELLDREGVLPANRASALPAVPEKLPAAADPQPL